MLVDALDDAAAADNAIGNVLAAAYHSVFQRMVLLQVAWMCYLRYQEGEHRLCLRLSHSPVPVLQVPV